MRSEAACAALIHVCRQYSAAFNYRLTLFSITGTKETRKESEGEKWECRWKQGGPGRSQRWECQAGAAGMPRSARAAGTSPPCHLLHLICDSTSIKSTLASFPRCKICPELCPSVFSPLPLHIQVALVTIFASLDVTAKFVLINV